MTQRMAFRVKGFLGIQRIVKRYLGIQMIPGYSQRTFASLLEYGDQFQLPICDINILVLSGYASRDHGWEGSH